MNTENIRRLFPAVYEQYLKENHDHEWSCKHDEYYDYCHGGGTVPIPACKYCTEYDGDRCMKRWNNADPVYYSPDLDDHEPDDLCEDYEWNGEWEED